jgi:hypothetical protein
MDDGAGVLQGWPAITEAMTRLFALAASQGVDLVLVDTDFARWPLSQPAVLGAFQQWAVSHRGCQARLLARDWQPALRHHGGWLRWQAPWAHRVSCLQMQPEDAPQWPGTLMVAAGIGALRVVDGAHDTARWVTDPPRSREWLQEIDVILQRSMNVTPHATLGL